MSRAITTSVLIAAAPSRVWSVLMDFDSYPSWNPFIQSLKGEKRLGGRLEAIIVPPGRKPATFTPVVVEYVPERVFCWRGSLPIPGLFTGEHRFALTPEAAGTRFEQSESFSGLLVPLVGGILRDSERGFRAMNDALKSRAESA
ncbi:SRPBCC domain-containing protein [Hyphomicrobium sp.]|uniref:SRPBCC domain-containing protein n=1 Tax=Hyphomicrobium sp. TaxID=82 RepID=UPI000FA54EA2|nr:SRPBCC domain-containing protein [Hyphomicrobium sp.]RUO97787.1 MAG: SRPBCC domain-containing protein [Hyphomicrobium sp.]